MSTESQIQSFRDNYAALQNEIGKVIVGHTEIVENTLMALFGGGHVLLEGVPGLGKTELVKTLARALDLEFRRIQFTPDLMPADIVGTNVMTGLCDKIVDLDANLGMVPRLAAGWEYPDSKTILIKLRPGVLFQDGEKLDAAAVKYTQLLPKSANAGFLRRTALTAWAELDFNAALTVGTGGLQITAGTGNVDFDGLVTIGANNLTVNSSTTTNITTGVSGTTGNVDINGTTTTNVDGAIALDRKSVV